MKLRIATRKSPLALWQAEHVRALLTARAPDLEIELVTMTTRGDRILDQALSKVGGKDLFVKEIEEALLDGRAEVAVHSLKDVPTVLPEPLVITAFPPREDPRDAFVSPDHRPFAAVPPGAKIGTSSLRRAAQLLRRRPDLEIVPLRGNVQTRLQKVEALGLAGTVLACAGLKRLGLESVVTEVFEPEVSLPAIGQGILAVETRRDDPAVNALVGALDDPAARAAATSERAFLHRLHGGCQVPIAAHATLALAPSPAGPAAGPSGVLRLRGLVASLDGREVFEDAVEGPVTEGAALGAALGERLLAAGAGRVLDALRGA